MNTVKEEKKKNYVEAMEKKKQAESSLDVISIHQMAPVLFNH